VGGCGPRPPIAAELRGPLPAQTRRRGPGVGDGEVGGAGGGRARPGSHLRGSLREGRLAPRALRWPPVTRPPPGIVHPWNVYFFCSLCALPLAPSIVVQGVNFTKILRRRTVSSILHFFF
jgi:hypothetical protein